MPKNGKHMDIFLQSVLNRVYAKPKLFQMPDSNVMTGRAPFSPQLLKENIFFLTSGTCIGAISILLFDNRLYSVRDVFLLFILIFLTSVVQAFIRGVKALLSYKRIFIFYLLSYITSFFFMTLLYAFLLPFSFSWLLVCKFSVLITAIETSLSFFIMYQKQYQLNVDKEMVIRQSFKQQQVKELEVLKQQIDPHFIFNSFNTLAFLIDENQEKAKQFSNKLANVHRYILFNSNKNLVSVADEIDFAKDYAYLQEMRYSNEVQIHFSGFSEIDNIFILPVSIQILIENAIKHNVFSPTNPLSINVGYENGYVAVENQLKAKNYETPSSKIGLSNLRDRCRLILGKELKIIKRENSFKVILPLLNK